MPDRPYISFAEVKEKIPIPEVLAKLGVADAFARQGDVLAGVCPLPSHQHGPSPNEEQFKINRKKGVWLWHCFGDCQKGGDVIELVKEMTGFDHAHVRFWFAEHFGDRLTLIKPRSSKNASKKATSGKQSKPKESPSPKETASDPSEEPAPLKRLRFQLNLDPSVPYLRDRGLSDKTIERYGLGLCRRGVLKDYVAIPVHDYPRPEGNEPVAYLGRWPGDDHDGSGGRPRYKWPDGFPKSRVVYGLHEALTDTNGKPLVVVEGPFKVFHLVQSGFPNAVAVFGSSLSDVQAAILAETSRPIVLMFDGNEAGQAGMRIAAGKLITRAFVRVVKLPDGREPDDLVADELRHWLR